MRATNVMAIVEDSPTPGVLKHSLSALSLYRRYETMNQVCKRLWVDDSGQDLIEYALVASLVGLGSVSSMSGLANSIAGTFNNIANALNSASGNNAPPATH
jgi:pilus assembly protein Flp/PilA